MPCSDEHLARLTKRLAKWYGKTNVMRGAERCVEVYVDDLEAPVDIRPSGREYFAATVTIAEGVDWDCNNSIALFLLVENVALGAPGKFQIRGEALELVYLFAPDATKSRELRILISYLRTRAKRVAADLRLLGALPEEDSAS